MHPDGLGARELNVVIAVRSEVKRYGLERIVRSVSSVRWLEMHDCPLDLAGTLDRPFDILVVSFDEVVDADAWATVDAMRGRGAKVLYLLDEFGDDDIARLDDLRDCGFLYVNDLDVDTVRGALVQLRNGQTPLPARLAQGLLAQARGSGQAGPDPSPAKLTPREREVLALLVEGLSNKQIARRLVISEHGVKRLVSNILAKLNAPNRTQAVARALREGL
ncbi:response regulator transcription factor [Amycolatopsis ultiminotia]|uniref:Response regulator transcription factor n=1 Tax=Amycolatopsis ultiminotia TaxID=543629 RepID=A0ABP6XH78_9PSEU